MNDDRPHSAFQSPLTPEELKMLLDGTYPVNADGQLQGIRIEELPGSHELKAWRVIEPDPIRIFGAGWCCPVCGRATYNSHDIEHEYCSCCGNSVLPKACEHRRRLMSRQFWRVNRRG
jgi:hypothetical protein